MSDDNAIRTHIYSIPDLVENYADVMWERVQQEVKEKELTEICKIVMTGCGYSYGASLQAKYILESITGISTEIAFSIDASRHYDLNLLPKGKRTLLIGVSSSGIVARIAETLERFRQADALTIAFSSDRQSKCAKQAEHVVDISCPALDKSLPLRSYVMTLLGCYCLAWAIALAQKRKGDAERKDFFQRLIATTNNLRIAMVRLEHQVNGFAECTAACKAHEFVGSGLEYGTAWLGRQLILGQSGVCGIDSSLEDWLHSSFFLNEPEKIGTMLWMPSNSTGLSRAIEVQHYMLHLKRPLCVITDSEDLVQKGAQKIILPYPQDYLFNPILNFVPAALYTGRITQLIGETYSRGFREPWAFSKGGYATEFSEIQIIR